MASSDFTITFTHDDMATVYSAIAERATAMGWTAAYGNVPTDEDTRAFHNLRIIHTVLLASILMPSDTRNGEIPSWDAALSDF